MTAELERTIRNMIFDLAWKFDRSVASEPEAQAALHELAALAGLSYTWAVSEVVDEAEYIHHGGYL